MHNILTSTKCILDGGDIFKETHRTVTALKHRGLKHP